MKRNAANSNANSSAPPHGHHLANAYTEATEVGGGLFAVRMSDGGWSIADGPGTTLSAPDEIECAGWHLPVRFASKEAAVDAIGAGPDAWFDIEINGAWVLHCVERGAVITEAYRRAH
ncbi:hypothetical protein LA345_40605 (plasmid) [Burkholderia vietnamiensis]|nr:hypothetical protein [Burkholderia vietnamiensis]